MPGCLGSVAQRRRCSSTPLRNGAKHTQVGKGGLHSDVECPLCTKSDGPPDSASRACPNLPWPGARRKRSSTWRSNRGRIPSPHSARTRRRSRRRRAQRTSRTRRRRRCPLRPPGGRRHASVERAPRLRRAQCGRAVATPRVAAFSGRKVVNHMVADLCNRSSRRTVSIPRSRTTKRFRRGRNAAEVGLQTPFELCCDGQDSPRGERRGVLVPPPRVASGVRFPPRSPHIGRVRLEFCRTPSVLTNVGRHRRKLTNVGTK